MVQSCVSSFPSDKRERESDRSCDILPPLVRCSCICRTYGAIICDGVYCVTHGTPCTLRRDCLLCSLGIGHFGTRTVPTLIVYYRAPGSARLMLFGVSLGHACTRSDTNAIRVRVLWRGLNERAHSHQSRAPVNAPPGDDCFKSSHFRRGISTKTCSYIRGPNFVSEPPHSKDADLMIFCGYTSARDFFSMRTSIDLPRGEQQLFIVSSLKD